MSKPRNPLREGMPEYVAWQAMIQRTTNPRNPNYHRYGGRGIDVCERWRSFDAFLADMGKRPNPRLTLERRDNNRGYHPDNCYWATRLEQQNNMRKNRVIEFNGKRQTVSQWARDLGIPIHTLSTRLRRGWSVERALTEEVHEKSC